MLSISPPVSGSSMMAQPPCTQQQNRLVRKKFEKEAFLPETSSLSQDHGEHEEAQGSWGILRVSGSGSAYSSAPSSLPDIKHASGHIEEH